MRVLHLTRDYPPRSTGGISTAVGGLVAAQLQAGLHCAVASFDAWRPGRSGAGSGAGGGASAAAPEQVDGVALLRLHHQGDLAALEEFAARHAPDVLHVHHSMLWPCAAELRQRHRAVAVKSVHVLHAVQNRLRGLARPTLSSSAQERAFAEADALIAPSRFVAEHLARLPHGRVRTELVPLGLDPQRCAPPAAARDPHCALYVGRFADLSGTAALWTAIARIAGAVPEARFVVAGGVPENRRAERRWCEQWLAQSTPALRARVEFTGWLAPAGLAALYTRAAVLLSPSWVETFGLVVLEGMAHGLAVVANRSGGVEDLIEPGVSGILVPPRDGAGLAEAAAALLADPAQARRLGEAARLRSRQFSWPLLVPRITALYQRLRAAR